MERDVSNTNILILFTENKIFYLKLMSYICMCLKVKPTLPP